ncbi:hypothetical protein FN846DRAFT_911434 [Sphaerosporella brunnea]|uniref:Uncharacterized protein n=1 Tax=Sphaerosporella brunnea TaxID=1250544 RepID=A0A5J5EM28_9PEZI|nr:hypothetical protein FN846DRAFT_911434 [Sphaerosporella brunnea]
MALLSAVSSGGDRAGFALLDFVNVGTPMDIVDAHNNVTNPENREAFPPNPKDAFSSNKNIYKNGGMAQIRRLAAQVKSGQTVKKSLFIIGAGSWMGTFNIGSV